MRFFSFLVAGLLMAAPAYAYADDETESNAPGTQEPSHADPSTKTLPATASATAQANAFGQQGERMKAAHAAAKAAAMDEAKKAAHENHDKAAKHEHGHGHHGHGHGHHGQGHDHDAD